MKPAPEPVSPLRQRFPFLPVLLCALAGILLAEMTPWPGAAWAGVAALAALVFYARRGLPPFAVAVVAIFGATHSWQSRESPAAALARQMGDGGWEVVAQGVVASEPRRSLTNTSSFEMRLSRLRIAGKEISAPVTVIVRWPGRPPDYGSELRAGGTLQRLEPPRNPGQFNFAAWNARRGIYSSLTVGKHDEAELLAAHRGHPVVALAHRARERMRDILTAGINDATVSELLVAMVLGETSDLPDSVQEEFRGTGTYHLFSVSGLHVGMLAVLLWFFLRICRRSRRQAALIIIPALFFYALMTGWKAASVRSAVMATIVIAGFITSRRPILLNNLFAAAVLILLRDTNLLFNAGFQLSFIVVLAIMLLTGPITRWLERPFQPDPFLPRKLLPPYRRWLIGGGEKFASLSATSIAAWVGSLPLTVWYFHLVSLTSLPANLLAIPISFVIMAVAVLSFGVGVFSAWLASVFNQVNWAFSHLLLAVVHFFSSLPGSFFYVGFPQIPAPAAELVVFDFHHGGAVWLTSGRAHWLLDCGPANRHDTVLVPFLRSHGLRSLDGLVVTHGDAGHIGSAAALVGSFSPRLVLDAVQESEAISRTRLNEALREKGRAPSLFRSGDTLDLAPNARLIALYPPPDSPTRVREETTLVLRAEVDGTRILFLSDAGPGAQAWLLAIAPEELRADILVLGSPGRGVGITPDFLDAVAPRVVIASAGNFPEGDTNPANFADRLRRGGIALFRQDECGAVTVKIFPRHFEISGFVNGRQYSSLR